MEENIDKTFLYAYLNNASPTGFEVEGQKLWLNYIRPFVDEVITDAYGTVVGVINPGQNYKVVIEAHADEISWFVSYISKEGFIYVRKNGGSDALIAPSMRVNIFSEKGVVKGVFGWPAIHIRGREEKPEWPKNENIWIDVGAKDGNEVKEMGIRPGTVVVFEDELMELNHRYLVGRALDNRLGGYMIAQVVKRLRAEKLVLPFTLFIVNSVQEEIGLRGAEMIAHRLKPDCAIITDVTHDTQTPLIDMVKEGDVACGKGPTVTTAPAVHRKLLQLIIEAAKQNNIPLQYEAASRSSGTDTDAFAYSNMGVPSALISLPLRYMHTTVEMVDKEDVEACIRLIIASLKSIRSGDTFSYFD